MSRQREFYIRHDFSYYDSGLLALLSPQVLLLYDLLRRYVWRSENHGNPEVRELLQAGLVVAHIRQGTLATVLGYTRRQTICEHMVELKKLGWVKTHMLSDSQTACFVLGEVVIDQNGRRHEVFFADAFLNELADHLDGIAQQKVRKEGEVSLLDLPFEDRIAATKAFLEAIAPPAEPARGSVPALHAGADRPGTRVRTQEVGSFGTPKREGTSEIEHAGGSAPLLPPVSAPKGRGGTGAEPSGNPSEGPTGERGLEAPGRSSLGLEEEDDLEPGEPESRTPSSSAPPPPAARRGVKPAPVLDPDRARELTERYRSGRSQLATQQLREVDINANRLATLKEGKQRSVPQRVLFNELESQWLTALRARNPGVTFAPWGPKEKSKIDVLVKGYGEVITRQLLTYAVEKWDDIVKGRFKGKPTTLSLALVAGMHESLALEAQKYALVARVEQQVQEWYRDHPEESLPEALAEEYARVRS